MQDRSKCCRTLCCCPNQLLGRSCSSCWTCEQAQKKSSRSHSRWNFHQDRFAQWLQGCCFPKSHNHQSMCQCSCSSYCRKPLNYRCPLSDPVYSSCPIYGVPQSTSCSCRHGGRQSPGRWQCCWFRRDWFRLGWTVDLSAITIERIEGLRIRAYTQATCCTGGTISLVVVVA